MRGFILLCAGLGCAVAAGRWIARERPAAPRSVAANSVPDSFPHVTVEVLNATKTPGLALAATLRLRHLRLDVVYYGNADSGHGTRSRNAILVRRGDTTGVGRAIAALGSADVVPAPDTTRLVDLSIMLGSAFGTAVASHR
ncbi:MAG TPA: LytR C-terminal domain-containing protein [Gemmatimonadales bacterium]